jgi:hypothetical protein
MGFENSNPKVYRAMQVEGEMKKIGQKDIQATLHPLLKMGFAWSIEGKLKKHASTGWLNFNTPWCHTRMSTNKNCNLDWSVCWSTFNFIHPRCLGCWKTVVAPKNFDELMKWYKIQHNEIEFSCKCGIELRDYVPRHYGAYHYASSLEEGREQYNEVKALAEKYLSAETANDVILKRGCTEYEMTKGPSVGWHLTEKEERLANLIDNYVEAPVLHIAQDKEIVHPHVHIRWLLFAHMVGDFSYLPYNNMVPLFPDTMKYHEGDLQDIKHDLSIVHTKNKYGIPAEVTEDFLGGTTKFADDHGFTLDKLGPALGYSTMSPSGDLAFNYLEDIDPKTIGEADYEPEGEE